ncbi:MAG: hypothetical protein QOI77_1091 [Blastocatellia bacterium]|nr:hypothetical protein [Blastocatellia bacterium]
MESKVTVTLYTRPGCHLCDEMKDVISSSGCGGLYALEELDIERDPELFARYQFEIPVLFINGVEAFRHRVSADEFTAYVTALMNQRR